MNRGVSVVEVDRRIVRLLAAVLAVVTVWAIDSGLAMHTEHNLAQEVKRDARLENTPNVFVGGIPFSAAFFTGKVPFLEVQSLDVEVPKLGMVNAATTLRDISLTPKQLLRGDFQGAPVSTYSRSISLDGVALGRLLGITDLSIANPDNISPTGGTSAEAELTGTLPGDTRKSTVKVTLRLIGPEFQMRVYDEDDERLIEAFTLELDTRQLPLPAQATSVKLHGGSISFEVQKRDITLSTAQLSPLEIEGAEQQAVAEAEQKAEDTAERVGVAPPTPSRPSVFGPRP